MGVRSGNNGVGRGRNGIERMRRVACIKRFEITVDLTASTGIQLIPILRSVNVITQQN